MKVINLCTIINEIVVVVWWFSFSLRFEHVGTNSQINEVELKTAQSDVNYIEVVRQPTQTQNQLIERFV